MTFEEAKLKAREGGYQDIGQNEHRLKDGQIVDCDYKLLLDPKFFQSLGKAMGWGKSDEYFDYRKYDYWQLQWHKFIDHVAQGKTPSDFFKTLI